MLVFEWRLSAERTAAANWCRHIYREHNKAADTHASWLMNNGDSSPGAQWEVADIPPLRYKRQSTS